MIQAFIFEQHNMLDKGSGYLLEICTSVWQHLVLAFLFDFDNIWLFDDLNLGLF